MDSIQVTRKRHTLQRRLNTISPYYTMFPVEFPLRQLQRAKSGEWVLDPFCGRGTTNFAARLLGLPSVGVDSNPVAVAIAAAKFVDVRADDVVDLCCAILAKWRAPKEVPKSRFWRLCYHHRTLDGICKLREELIRDCSTQERVALRALLLGILHGPRLKGQPSYLSNQMPRTYATKPRAAVSYWLRKNFRPEYVDVLEVVKRRANYLFAASLPKTNGFAIKGDSRYISSNRLPRFRWVVTSPPYLAMNSYIPDQWLRSWFIGGPPTVEYTHEGQLGYQSKERFISNLAEVWRQVSATCETGAHLIIRFGALPSSNQSPVPLLKESLSAAKSGWRILTIKQAGRASQGYRQAYQFGLNTGADVEEVDLHAILEKSYVRS